MASTNKTTNYELSQYIGTDKPTYLTDYNQDMFKIDAGIHAAKSEADTNTSSIGTLSSLTTTAKNNLVAAANEINAKAGNLASLDTTSKSSLVSAINELVSIVDKFNLVNIINLTKDDMSGNPYGEGNGLTCAFNSDYSVCKIYGTLTGVTGTGTTFTYLTNNAVIPAQYRPTSDIIVNPCGFSEFSHSTNYYNKVVYLTIRADGKISVTINKGTNTDGEMTTTVIPFIIFLKDFGDVPIPL